MALVDRESIEIQLDREIEKLAPADQELCRALLKAIRHVQLPEAFKSIPGLANQFRPLPATFRKAIENWAKTEDRRWRSDPDRIRRQIKEGEQYGLSRSRTLARTSSRKSAQPTLYALAAQRLRLSESTVIRKAGKRSVTNRTAKK